MSWLARSIANSLNFDDDDVNAAPNPGHNQRPDSNDDASSPTSPPRGVKEDLSELSNTLTQQFWGMASFLAPPPQPELKPPSSESDQGSILGIRSDFAEIGGKFRSGISQLSTNINVSEITKLASNLLQSQSESESDDESEGTGKRESFDYLGEGVVGVTEDVAAFASDIAVYPRTWLDFPLPENVDFDMTDAQQEHALAIERLSPRLAALRIELCPGYMPESCFWMIYFVLLHPILDKPDAELLSTPQVMEVRALLGQESMNQSTIKPEDMSEKQSSDLEEIAISGLNTVTSSVPPTPEIVHIPIVERTETQTPDNPITEDKRVDQVKDQYLKSGSSTVPNEDNADDDWLKEETSEVSERDIPIENDDDVSFSDLEEDDGDIVIS